MYGSFEATCVALAFKPNRDIPHLAQSSQIGNLTSLTPFDHRPGCSGMLASVRSLLDDLLG
jgi:hypothetical protein